MINMGYIAYMKTKYGNTLTSEERGNPPLCVIVGSVVFKLVKTDISGGPDGNLISATYEEQV
ncbi:MAG: hypothetical protein COB41_00280 [Proteobacteria bacterium]|nr:MAG: hypothetical protein COB41_00280 [Pseudomonadota bacterium]